VWRRWRWSVRIGKPSHGLMHTRVLLELVHGDSILHAIHSLSVGQSERISINPVDELHGVDKLKPVNETSEGLFAKPGIRINLLVVFKYILIVIQSLDNSIEEVVDSNLLNMAVLRRSKPHSLQSCQSCSTIQASAPSHGGDNLTKVDGFSHGHSHQLRKHRRIQPTSHTTHTSHPSQQLLHISSLPRSTVLSDLPRHHSTISCAVSLPTHRRSPCGEVTLLSSPGTLYSSAGSIAADQVTPCRVSAEQATILVIRSRAAVTWHLPRLGTSPRHHVHTVLQLVHVGVLAADVVLPVPVESAFRAPNHNLPLGLRVIPGLSTLPFTRVLSIASTPVQVLALVVLLPATDGVSNLAPHHRHVVTVGVAVLGGPEHILVTS